MTSSAAAAHMSSAGAGNESRSSQYTKAGKAGGGQNGAERNVAGKGHDDGKNQQGKQRSRGRERKKNAQSGGNALASLEAKPHRKHVSDEGRQRGNRGQRVKLRRTGGAEFWAA